MSETPGVIDFVHLGIGRALANYRLRVPPNQRDYAWEDDRVKELFQDFARAIKLKTYFLGSVVLTRGEDGVLEVADGQQRLATVTIGIAAIRDYFHTRGDAMSGKGSLIGMFDRFTLSAYPAQLPPFWAFLQLVDGIGRYELMVEVHDLREDTIIARMKVVVEFPERTNRVNIPFQIAGLPLAHPGVYDFIVTADGKEINRQRLEANLIGGETDAPNEPSAPDSDGE